MEVELAWDSDKAESGTWACNRDWAAYCVMSNSPGSAQKSDKNGAFQGKKAMGFRSRQTKAKHLAFEAILQQRDCAPCLVSDTTGSIETALPEGAQSRSFPALRSTVKRGAAWLEISSLFCSGP